MSNEENLDLDKYSLSGLFDRGWEGQQELEKSCCDPESSEKYIAKRKRLIKMLQKCEFMLEEISLFSENESLDDMTPSETRYFLNWALLGWLTSKVHTPSQKQRLISLEQAKEYYVQFLQLTRNYEFHTMNVKKLQKTTTDKDGDNSTVATIKASSMSQGKFDLSMVEAAHNRSEKIRRFKEQKELETKLTAIRERMAQTNAEIDEDEKKKFYTSFVKFWINRALDELKWICDEIRILTEIEMEKVNLGENHHRNMQPLTGVKPGTSGGDNNNNNVQRRPFIITKDDMQAKVFGLGYPSVPVYSIDEFYNQLEDKGHMPAAEGERLEPVIIGGGVTDTQKQDDKAKMDELEDQNDETHLQQQRNWDEFKDENKRGAGNRHNRS